MGGLILPKSYSLTLDAPLIYLLGNGVGWREQAFKRIMIYEPGLYVASPVMPKRYELRAIQGERSFAQQLRWEEFHLRRAKHTGCVLLWSAAKAGLDSVAEQLVLEAQRDRDVTLVVGGLHPLSIAADQNSTDIRMYATLEETCAAAVAECRDKQRLASKPL